MGCTHRAMWKLRPLLQRGRGPSSDPLCPGVVVGQVFIEYPTSDLVGTERQKTACADGLIAAVFIEATDRQRGTIEGPQFSDLERGVDSCPVNLRRRYVNLNRQV